MVLSDHPLFLDGGCCACLRNHSSPSLPFFQQQAQSTGKSFYGPIHDYRGGRNSHAMYNPDGTDHGIITMGPVQNSAPLSSSNAMELGTLAPSRYPQHISDAERTCHCNLGLCLYCGGQGHFSDNCSHKKTSKMSAAKLQVIQESHDLYVEDSFNNLGKVFA